MTNTYYQIHKTRFEFIKKITDSLGLNSKSKILDIGCYPPYLFEYFSNKYLAYGVCSAHEKVKHKNVITLDIERDQINFKHKFNLIIATEIIEHLLYPHNLLKNSKKLLSKKGFLLITTPNATRLQNLLKIILNKNIYFHLDQLLQNINHRHNREYSLEELNYLLQRNNLKIYKSGFFTAYDHTRNRPGNILHQAGRFLNYIFCLFFKNRSDTIWILAQKS